MVVINKIDLYSPQHRDVREVKKALKNLGLESFAVSALTGEGLEDLKVALFRKFYDGPSRK
jgi:putative ribosome biogenesis GTPase RsgA